MKNPTRELKKLFVQKGEINKSFFELGNLLVTIRKNRDYEKIGYKNFTTYIEDELGISMRTAQYLMKTYRYYFETLGDVNIIDQMRSVGWSKAKELIGIIDESNDDYWIETANNNSAQELKQIIRSHRTK